MSKKPKPIPAQRPDVPEPPKGQHIFPADDLHVLAIRWKNTTDPVESMALLESIIELSTPMFERLAQHENFHYTVDLPCLVNAAQEKVVKWLHYWDPKKGKLFTFFSKCARHAFLSELVKVNQHRRIYHATGDSLEKFMGAEDPTVNKHDLAAEVQAKLRTLTCRWGSPQELGTLRYLIDCIVDDERDRQAAIRSAAYAWGLSLDQVKFFHGWALCAMRAAFVDKVRVPFTEQDLFIIQETYSHIPDLLDIMSWAQLRKFMARYGGRRLPIPPLSTVAKAVEDYRIWQDIDRSDMDPESIATIARKHKKSARSASEIFEEMCHKLDPHRSGEFDVYDS